jgi:hypothetical protein
MGTGVGTTTAMTAATNSQAAATAALTAAIFEMTLAYEAAAVAATNLAAADVVLYDAQGMVAFSANAAAASQGAFALTSGVTTAAAARNATAGAAGLAAGAMGLVSKVFISGMAAEVLASLMPKNPLSGENLHAWDLAKALGGDTKARVDVGSSLAVALGMFDPNAPSQRGGAKSVFPYSMQYALSNPLMLSNKTGTGATGASGVNNAPTGLTSNSDKVTGQRAITYNITIQKMNGIETVNSSTVKENVEISAHALKRLMTNVVNDSQIRDSE